MWRPRCSHCAACLRYGGPAASPGRFARLLFPDELGGPRRLETLRVGDAIAAGASYREMAIALYGEAVVREEWRGRSDFLMSRVRRRAAEARAMTAGGWRALLGS